MSVSRVRENRMHGSMRRREATTASRANTRRAAMEASRRPYILDVFSRYIVGWTVQHQEIAPLAERLIAETLAKQKIARHQQQPGDIPRPNAVRPDWSRRSRTSPCPSRAYAIALRRRGAARLGCECRSSSNSAATVPAGKTPTIVRSASRRVLKKWAPRHSGWVRR
jgi:transposase InsO family protein